MKAPQVDPVKGAIILLRVALTLVFLYAAVGSFMQPNEWVGYLPRLVTDYLDEAKILILFSVIELIVAGLLIAGVYVRYTALAAAAMLLGIVLSNFSLFAITFRDLSLAVAALALAMLSENKPIIKTLLKK